MWIAIAAVAGALLGLVVGFCVYRSSRRWCGICGGNLSCPTCTPARRRGRNAGPTLP
nr:hypothetical protein [Micromonospora sp. DSM 115978]